MARNAGNILRHELIGLQCEVVSSRNASHSAIRGSVVDETMKTLVIEAHGVRKRVAKAGAVFRFRLPGATVRVDGDHIVARPEERIRKKFRKW